MFTLTRVVAPQPATSVWISCSKPSFLKLNTTRLFIADKFNFYINFTNISAQDAGDETKFIYKCFQINQIP
jgi:hypothetical protein